MLSVSSVSAIAGSVLRTAYKVGTFQLWIDNESNLIFKAEFTPSFEATLGDEHQSSQTFMHENDFIEQLDFSNYDQTLNIQIPEEALQAN